MKKLGRILATILSITLLITSCPEVLAAGLNAEIVEVDANGQVFNETTLLDDAENDDDMSKESASDETAEQTSKEEDSDETADQTSEEEKDELLEATGEEESEETLVTAEESSILLIDKDTESSAAGQLEKDGWSWDKSTATLILKGANLTKGLKIDGVNATIDVQADSSISFEYVEGEYGYESFIVGAGTAVTVKGGHKLTLGSDKAVSKKSALAFYGSASLEICDGTKVYISDYSASNPISMNDYSVLSMTGTGTELNISSPIDTLRAAIGAYMSDAPQLKINDGATFTFTTGTTSATGTICILNNKTAKVDLRGGKVVVNNTGTCDPNTVFIFANSIRYDDDAALVNSKMLSDDSSAAWRLDGAVTGTVEAPVTYSLTGTNSPRLVAVKQPEKLTSVKSGVSTGNPTLSFELDVLNGTADGPITYTWKKDGVEVETNTSGSYTIGALETGLYKYTCTATATSGGKAIEETSDMAVVIASEAGKKISETLYFDETSESVDKLSEYGYKYDKNTGTLTLAGAVIYNQLYLAGDKAFKVVLKEGTDSYIYRINSTGGYALGFSCMNSEISGTGKLHIKCKDNYQTKGIYTGNYYGKDGYGEVSIKDGAQIDISVVDGLAVYVYYNGSINIEGQGTKVNIKKNYTISYGLPDFCVIYAETGSKFILTNKAELAVDYENKESSGAIIYGYYNVKNISVINGAKVTANVNTFLPLINSSGNVDITGGNLSLHSLAACSAAGTGVIKIYSSSSSPASFLRSDDSETETSGLATFTEKGINTNGAVTDVSISSTSGPRVKIIKNPESMYKVLRNDPNTPNLTVEAKTYEMASTQVISYQWYSCDSLGENASKIAGATSEKFKVPTMTEYKSAYYYCLVSAKYNGKTYTRKSTVAEVRGVSKLTTPRKTSLYIDSLTADSSSETEGWSYEYSTKTLTLNGFELTNGQLRLPAGVTIVLAEGSINSIDNQLNDYPLYAMNGTLTIKGNGVLDITSNQASGYVVQCNYGTLNIEGNALVHIKPCEGKKLYHARIDGGSFKALAPENASFVKNGGFYLNDEHYYGELWLSGTESTVVFPRWKELSGPVAVKQNETATLSAQAESTDPKALLTYSWRSCDENGATISVLDDQKGKNLTISDTKTLGTSYYYCRVTTTIQVGLNSYDIYINSDVMGVTVNESGRISRSKILDLKSATTDQKNRAEGWEYKAATRTLTLDNADLGPVSGYATAISLPADSTIVLADGTNNIVRGSIEAKGNLTIEGSGSLKADMTLNTYSISVSGQLIVRNNAVIDLTNNVSSYAAIYCKCLKVEQSTLRTKTKYNYQVCFNGENDLSLAAAKLDKGTYEKHNGCVRGEAIEDAYYEMSILPTEDVLFTFDKDITYHSLVTTSIGATAPVLDVHAKVYGGNEKISYQWYEVSNFDDPVNYKTAVNCKQANYTVNNSARGIKYYMCAAEATINGKKQTIYTNVCAVVTAAQGKKPVTGLLEVSDTYCKSYSCTGTFLEDYAEGKGAEYGISFTAKTSTECAKLTLTDVTICNAFSTNNSYGDGLDLVKEIDLVIPEGTKTYVYGGADGISWRNSCTISGSGTLITQGTQGARNENTLSRDGQLKVTDTSWEMGNWQYAGFESIVLDNAKVKVDGSFATSYACGNLKLINGSILRVSDRADIFGNLEIDANSAAYIHGSSATALKMADAANQTISVDGILSLSAEGKGQNRTIIFGGLTDYDASHMTNQGTSPIKLPESGITSSDYSYSSAYGGMVLTTTDELLFAPASFQKKAVGAIAKPAGTAAVNSKLTAGDLTPADATVSYQWQYASTANAADEFWEDISSQNDKTYTPSGTYENKYLRVKASGYGQYTGTVYSPVVGPVSGDPAGLSSLVIDHNSALLGGFSGSIHTYTSTVNKMKNADGSMPTMSIQAVPVSSDATVLIRNTTTAEGFNPAVINGVSGDIELYTDGEVGTITNTILVEVCYQGKITTYTVNVYVRIADASIKLYDRRTGCVMAS